MSARRPRPRSLRARVALAAAAAILLALAALTLALSLVLGHELHRSLDDALQRRAGEVARLSATAPALLTRPGALDAPLGGRELLVQVLDRRGRTLARSTALHGDELPAGELAAEARRRARSGYADARLRGGPVRLFAAPLADVGGPAAGGAVLVAGSTTDVDRSLARVRRLGLLALALAAVLGALLAAALVRRALAPLDRLSRAAAEIERTGDAGRRLPEAATADELGRLGETLNRMLAALERARDAERRFVADASHEPRTPLTALRGNVAYLSRHGADAATLADLGHDVTRLGALLDELLALAREDAAPRPHERVDLAGLVRAAATGRATVSVVAADDVTVPGDADALARALGNLLDNAARHGPAGGAIRAGVEADAAEARVWVADDGPGLRREDAGVAFERFWRGRHRQAGPGTGLGLAIVRATAERHQGRVSVDGSRFTLHLPRT